MPKGARLVMEDSFDAIYRDLKRVGQDGDDVIKKEFAVALGEIIDLTPVRTGQCAAAWTVAGDALGAAYRPIAGRVSSRRGGKRKERSISNGYALGSFEEIKKGARGDSLAASVYEAKNRDKIVLGLEYGWFRFAKAMHVVRESMKRMRQRIGPFFAKAFKTRMAKVKHKKRTVVEA